MMWHVGIGGLKHRFYTTSLYNLISYIYIYVCVCVCVCVRVPGDLAWQRSPLSHPHFRPIASIRAPRGLIWVQEPRQDCTVLNTHSMPPLATFNLVGVSLLGDTLLGSAFENISAKQAFEGRNQFQCHYHLSDGAPI